MRILHTLVFVSLLLLLTCSRESETINLPDPGFGITVQEIHAGTTPFEIPVLMKSAEPVKGLQFTLKWDPSTARVAQPVLASGNPDFSISSNQGQSGSMKVLVFSLQGAIMNLDNPEIIRIPVQIISPDAEQFSLKFDAPIFAGPSAKSYEIPVSHATLRVIR